MRQPRVPTEQVGKRLIQPVMLHIIADAQSRAKGWIGGTYQDCNRLCRATAPFTREQYSATEGPSIY